MSSWAIAGVDLLVDVRSRRGLRTELERALRDAVRSGLLVSGTRLPSARQLAVDLGVARNTVADVYTQLIAEGHLQGRAGAGTVVAPQAVPSDCPSLGRAGSAPGTDSGRAGWRPGAPSTSATPLDLRPGAPDLSLFPRAAWVSALRSALARAPREALGYGDPRGTPALRAALAQYLARTRGVRADPGQIIVCAGYTQAAGLLLRVLARRGTPPHVAAESPGLAFRSPEQVTGHGAELIPLPVDAGGARTDILDELGAAGPINAVMLTPAHQFPTGMILAAERRATAVRWAEQTGAVLVEDDYDGEFRYDRAPIGAMHGLAPDRIVYVGSVSKALAPALRLGWMVAPPSMLDELVAEKQITDHHTPTLDQLTLAELIDTGGYDRQVRRARLAYRKRRRHLVDTLAPLPGIEPIGKEAGLQVLLRFPPGCTAEHETVVIDAARARGLAVTGIREHSGPIGHDEWGPGLVIGYATPPEHAFDLAVHALRDTLAATVASRG